MLCREAARHPGLDAYGTCRIVHMGDDAASQHVRRLADAGAPVRDSGRSHATRSEQRKRGDAGLIAPDTGVAEDDGTQTCTRSKIGGVAPAVASADDDVRVRRGWKTGCRRRFDHGRW